MRDIITRGLCDKYKRKIKDADVTVTVHDALLYKYPKDLHV